MAEDHVPSGGENFNLRDILLRNRRMNLDERTRFFSEWIHARSSRSEALYLRMVTTMADREVEVIDPATQTAHRMLMFGSNNYLGLAAHPYVRERIKQAVDAFGAGVGGPPLLNGYTALHHELEERLSAMKQKESTLLFQSGYGANVGLVSSLASGKHDTVFYDSYCHASFYDGIKMADAPSVRFAHNDLDELDRLLTGAPRNNGGDRFVGVEGVYSMDGDLAPLDRLVPLCRKHDAILMIDDAHGTGVMGPNGAGTGQHFRVGPDIDVVMGTLSKAFGVVGAFVSTSQPIADYLRFFARSYMFSSSIPPAVVASVLASLDLLERDPSIIARLRDNVAYTKQGLRRIGFDVDTPSAVIALIAPPGMNLRKANAHFDRAGIFLNSVEYPAVPAHLQRFRISLMASHTRADIDRLLEVVEEVWSLYAPESQSAGRTVTSV